MNPTESLIEREIRLQKEREEALANERQQAQLSANHKTITPPTISEAPPTKEIPDRSVCSSSAELRISQEIRELKRREEELRRLRDVREEKSELHDVDSDHMTSMTTSADEGLYSDADAHSDEPTSRSTILVITYK